MLAFSLYPEIRKYVQLSIRGIKVAFVLSGRCGPHLDLRVLTTHHELKHVRRISRTTEVRTCELGSSAGEDIRYLARGNAPDLPDYDYWLFDSSKLVVMRFDETDRFIGGELAEDPAEIVQASYWRDAAWHKAVRRDDFAGEPSSQRA